MAATTGKAGVELVQKMIAQRVSGGGIDKLLLGKVRITSAENGKLTAEMTVEKEHTNIGGTFHGGMSSYLVDSLSSLTLSTCPEVKNTGVSVNIHMSFLKTAAIGQEIEIISKVDKAGGKIAFMSVDIVNKTTGELVAKGSHTKLLAINRPQSEVPR